MDLFGIHDLWWYTLVSVTAFPPFGTFFGKLTGDISVFIDGMVVLSLGDVEKYS